MNFKLYTPANMFIAIFAGFFSFFGFSQELKETVKLDTVIHLNNLPIKNLSVRSYSLITSDENQYIIYPFSRNKMDTFFFVSINKKDKAIKNFVVYAPALKKEIYSPEAMAISINNSFIVIAYSKKLAFFKLGKANGIVNNISFLKAVDVPITYKFLQLNNEGRLTCGSIYNRSRKKSEENSIIDNYLFNGDTLIKENSITPHFDNIEFSHFNPNNWIAANSNYTAVSQTTAYNIVFYNKQGKAAFSINTHKDNWVQVKNDQMKNIRKHVPEHYPSILIDSLKDLNDYSISRIEGIWFLNEHDFFVRYFQYDTASKKKIHFFDQYNIVSDTAYLVKANLMDGKFPIKVEETVTKQNYNLLTWNYNNYIGNDNIVIFKNYAPIQYLNRTWLDIKKEEELYYRDNAPIPSLFIFDVKK